MSWLTMIEALASYWSKHGGQIKAMFGTGSSVWPARIMAALEKMLPLVKQWWPAVAANGLADDTVAIVRTLILPAPPTQPDM